VSPVKYKLGLYIPEDDILHSHCSENPTCYVGTSLSPRSNSGLAVPLRTRPLPLNAK
jgi:hypothetical protein